MIVVTLLAYGCPVQAIVQALDMDERTVATWRDRAGVQCQRVHEAIVEQGKLDLVHVQADEIRVKGRAMMVWMGLAMMVSTRLWLAGACVCADCPSGPRGDRWVGSVPKQHQTSISRTDQSNGRKRKGLFTSLDGFMSRHGDQAHREETSR